MHAPPPPITLSSKPRATTSPPRLSQLFPSLQDVSPPATPPLTMAQPHPPPTGEAPGLSPFESLPFDVILSITSHLDYLTVLRLSLTNTRLHSSLHPDALVPRSVKADFLQHVAESYPQHRHSLTCFRCLRILPRLAFADTHRAGRKGKHSSYPEKQRLRFCHDCGARGLLYPDMRGFRVNGVRHWLCHTCGIWYFPLPCPHDIRN